LVSFCLRVEEALTIGKYLSRFAIDMYRMWIELNPLSEFIKREIGLFVIKWCHVR